MKKLILFSIILLSVCAVNNTSLAQLRLVVGPSFGMTQPTVDYSGETTDFYAGTKYGLRSGLNYGAMAKLVFGPINAKLSLSYVNLDNSGQGSVNQPNSKLDIKNSIFTIGIGTEFGFGLPASPLRPYAGIDFLLSTISGSFQFQGTPNVDSDVHSIQSSSRTGLGLALGGEYKLGRSVSLDLSLHYNLLNLFGKDIKTGGTKRIDSFTSLNDGADPLYSASNTDHPLGNSRTIATIQIQIGLLFGF